MHPASLSWPPSVHPSALCKVTAMYIRALFAAELKSNCVADGVLPVKLGPFNVAIAAASPSAADTRIPDLEGNTTELVAGVLAGPFTIEANDEFGNAASTDCTGYTVSALPRCPDS